MTSESVAILQYLNRKSSTAAELSDALGIPRKRLDSILQGMRKFGLVSCGGCNTWRALGRQHDVPAHNLILR